MGAGRNNIVASVIVPHRGPVESLLPCLQAVRSQSFDQTARELIIVLNQTFPDGKDLKLGVNEKVILEPRGHSYSARNSGIREAVGDVLAFTDSDAIPHKHWLARGIEAMGEETAFVSGTVIVPRLHKNASSAELYELLYAFDQERNFRNGVSVTANLFISRSAITTFGEFSPELVSGGDFEWTSKVFQSGADCRFAPDAIVMHPPRTKLSEIFAKAIRTASYLRKIENPLPVALRKGRESLAWTGNAKKRANLTFLEQARAKQVHIAIIGTKALLAIGYTFIATLRRIRTANDTSSRKWAS